MNEIKSLPMAGYIALQAFSGDSEYLKDLLRTTNAVMLQGLKSGQQIGEQASARKIKRLVNALLDIRGYVASGSAEMHIIDEALGELGIEPWKLGFRREDVFYPTREAK